MGLFDSILGRSKPAKPDLDNLFGLPSAAITLDAEYENVLVGLPIESTLTTMPLIPPAPFDAKGMLRSVKACHVHLWSSMGGEWRWNEGSDDGNAGRCDGFRPPAVHRHHGGGRCRSARP